MHAMQLRATGTPLVFTELPDPVPGSVIPSAQTVSPRTIPGRYARFCASVP